MHSAALSVSPASNVPRRTAPPSCGPAPSPARVNASGRFGVTISAMGRSFSFISLSASACIRAQPLVGTITGSTTIWRGPYVSRALTTASSVAASFTMPTFTASGRMSSITAAIWSYTACGGRACTYLTPTVFCTVTAVTAVAPYTPSAENVLRSACRPAPPEGSDPAMESADIYLFFI